MLIAIPVITLAVMAVAMFLYPPRNFDATLVIGLLGFLVISYASIEGGFLWISLLPFALAAISLGTIVMIWI